jgi:hypothetical protein
MHVGIFVMDRTCAQANETDHACPLDLLWNGMWDELCFSTRARYTTDVVAAHHCQENKKRRMTQDQKRCIWSADEQ